jgi:hypothetical protein
MAKFFIKKVDKPIVNKSSFTNSVKQQDTKNNVDVNINDMDTKEKISIVNDIMNQDTKSANRVKKIVKDKGIIERTESSKVLLTEDNKELLMD